MPTSAQPSPRRLEFQQGRLIYLRMNQPHFRRTFLHQILGQFVVPLPNRLDEEKALFRDPTAIIFRQVLLIWFGFSDLDSALACQLPGSSRKKDLAA
jgi:hypothetical protein